MDITTHISELGIITLIPSIDIIWLKKQQDSQELKQR